MRAFRAERHMIAVICGMRSEAALLPRGTAFACTGGNAARAYDEAQRLLAEGAAGLLSFGIAGGLDPALRPGDLIVGTGVVVGDHTLPCDAAWAERLHAAVPGAKPGAIYGAANAVTFPAEKDSLFRRTRAVAVDLESAGMALACAEAGRPCAVLRAIADPASRAIPPSALKGLTPMGRIDSLPVLRSLLANLGEAGGLMRLGMETRTALGSLADAARRLGPALGFEALAPLGDQ
jgi:hopanoid-associated phosphorylase